MSSRLGTISFSFLFGARQPPSDEHFHFSPFALSYGTSTPRTYLCLVSLAYLGPYPPLSVPLPRLTPLIKFPSITPPSLFGSSTPLHFQRHPSTIILQVGLSPLHGRATEHVSNPHLNANACPVLKLAITLLSSCIGHNLPSPSQVQHLMRLLSSNSTNGPAPISTPMMGPTQSGSWTPADASPLTQLALYDNSTGGGGDNILHYHFDEIGPMNQYADRLYTISVVGKRWRAVYTLMAHDGPWCGGWSTCKGRVLPHQTLTNPPAENVGTQILCRMLLGWLSRALLRQLKVMLPSNVNLFLLYVLSRGKPVVVAHLPLCVIWSISCMTRNSYVHQSSKYPKITIVPLYFHPSLLLQLFSSDFQWNLLSCKSYADRQTDRLFILGRKSVRPTQSLFLSPRLA